MRMIEKVKEICGGLGYTVEIIDTVKCGPYSLGFYRLCVDFGVI